MRVTEKTSSSKVMWLPSAALAGFLSLFAADAKADLIRDGGFESGPSFGPWSQGGNTVSDTLNPPNHIIAPTHSGNYQAWMGCPSGTSFLAQQVSTTPGYLYNVDFWLANGATGPASYDVSWGGTTYVASSGSVVPAFGYTEFSFTAPYVGTALTTLQFTFFNQNDWFRLDDVSVVGQRIPQGQQSSFVPDQGLGLGSIGLVLGSMLFWSRRFGRPQLAD